MVSFDISSLPSNIAITSATLEIKYSNYATSPWAYNDSPLWDTDGTFAIHTVTKAWKEIDLSNGTASYAMYKDSFESNALDTYNYIAGNDVWAGFDVTTAVSNMAAGSIENNGFMIITDSPVSDFEETDDKRGGLWSSWASSDNPTITNRPKLTVEYTSGTSIASKCSLKSIISNISLSSSKISINSMINVPNAKIEIFTLRGVTVFSSNNSLVIGSNDIRMKSNLSCGTYLLKVSGENVNMIKRVFVK